jgi:hypothetical protein
LSLHPVTGVGARASTGVAVSPGVLEGHPLDHVGMGALLDLVPVSLVDAVIAGCGRQQQRVRALPARVTPYFVLALWLRPQAGYREVLEMLYAQVRGRLHGARRATPSVAAAVQARRRLGREPLKALFQALRGAHAGAQEPGMSMFGYELALLKVSVDGTRLDIADTPANRRAFGEPPTGRCGGGRYPQIRVLAVIACGTRAILDAVWGPWSTGEMPLLDKLVRGGAIRRGMLVPADRYFTGHPQASQVAATGAHLIFRTPARRVLPPVTELSDGSYLALPPGPVYSRKGDWQRRPEQRAPRLGLRKRRERGIRVRVVEAAITVAPEHGEPRTEHHRLITTLLDPAQAPAEQIALLYAERWESETGYAELKTYLRAGRSVLRSKDPDGVAQELYALPIAYQLVQTARAKAALDQPAHPVVDPDRISFTATLRALIRVFSSPGPPRRLLHDALDEVRHQPLLTRRPRTKPRALKGTPTLALTSTKHPPSKATYTLTLRKPTTQPA